jgi:hypothetical protein
MAKQISIYTEKQVEIRLYIDYLSALLSRAFA